MRPKTNLVLLCAVLVFGGCYSTRPIEVEIVDPDTGEVTTIVESVTEETPLGSALWSLAESATSLVLPFLPGGAIAAPIAIGLIEQQRRKRKGARQDFDAVVEVMAEGGGPKDPEAARKAMIEGMADGSLPMGLKERVTMARVAAGDKVEVIVPKSEAPA